MSDVNRSNGEKTNIISRYGGRVSLLVDKESLRWFGFKGTEGGAKDIVEVVEGTRDRSEFRSQVVALPGQHLQARSSVLALASCPLVSKLLVVS
jgi:hypothetical protein